MGGNLFGIGLGELIFLAILILVIFGPQRIPEIARTVGRFTRQIREATTGFDREIRQLTAEIQTPETWLETQQQARQPSQEVLGPPTSSPTPEQAIPSPEKVDQDPPSLSE